MAPASIIPAIRVTVAAASLWWIAPAAAADDLLSGEWVGSYVCNQGLTALTLTIAAGGEQWSGIFAFGPDKANKDVPRGSYELTISERDGRIDLVPGAWIEQPEGYVTVALRGALSDDLTTLSGEVDFEGCESFETRRISAMPVIGSKTKPAN
jgi:hypothetical protein